MLNLTYVFSLKNDANINVSSNICENMYSGRDSMVVGFITTYAISA